MRIRHWFGYLLILSLTLSVAHLAWAGNFFRESKAEQKSSPPKTYLHVPDRCRYLIPDALEFPNPSWGLAQIDQESNCNPYAVSPVGAIGVAQIMPENLEWLEFGPCKHLGRADPENPDWAMPCYAAFMDWFTVDEFPKSSYCSNLHVDSMRYNGGFYIIWELREALAKWNILSFETAQLTCGTRMSNGRKRSAASCKENYEYPERIGHRQSQYRELGGQMCPFSI